LPLLYIAGKDPSTAVGGHSTYVRAHALAAVAAGYAPHIFCVDSRAGRCETEYGVIHRVASPVPWRRHPAMVAHGPWLTAAVRRLLRGAAGDHLVHGFGPWSHVAVRACRALGRHGVRAVPVASAYTTLAHDWRGKLAGLRWGDGAARRLRYAAEYLWIRGVAGRCERQGYAASRLVLVNYDSVRRLLAEGLGVQAEIRRIPYASVAAFRTDQGGAAPPPSLAALRPAGAPLVMTLARHDPRKGLDLLLRCLASLQAAGMPFRACLVGPGTLLEQHRRLAATLGLSGSTALVGRVDDPLAYLRHADIFVLPSHEEGSGSVALLEALQMGCAVVASRCDGIPEDLTSGDNALLTPPGDEAALRSALAALLADEELRRRLAARARATYEARFSAAGLVAALAAAYADLGFAP
jgi:glycosyltransferase involved in cell wall biosynthesis